MKLIIGLGNPGKTYRKTRHNIGFMCLEHFAKTHNLSFSQRKDYSQIAQGEVEGIPLLLAKPLTYMNNSGKAVAKLMRDLNIPLKDLVVVYDDMDLPLGQMRIRAKGSSGGHHGIESIISYLGSQDFTRIRVGIGHPQEGDVISFLLSPFTPQEEGIIKGAIARTSEALLFLLREGVEKAMSKYNKKG